MTEISAADKAEELRRWVFGFFFGLFVFLNNALIYTSFDGQAHPV